MAGGYRGGSSCETPEKINCSYRNTERTDSKLKMRLYEEFLIRYLNIIKGTSIISGFTQIASDCCVFLTDSSHALRVFRSGMDRFPRRSRSSGAMQPWVSASKQKLQSSAGTRTGAGCSTGCTVRSKWPRVLWTLSRPTLRQLCQEPSRRGTEAIQLFSNAFDLFWPSHLSKPSVWNCCDSPNCTR